MTANRRIILICTLLGLLTGGLNSCQEQIEPSLPSEDWDYYPLRPGNEWVYDETGISYEISGFDTTYREVRETVLAVDTPATRVYRYMMERSSRSNPAVDWVVDSIYYLKLSEDWLLTQIGNLTFMSLSFPVEENKEWDYNNHNTLPEQLVRYQIDSQLSRSPFDTLLEGAVTGMRVILSDIPKNIVNQNEQYELYVKNIGLIEKKSIVLEFCTVGCDSAGQINTGRYMLKQLKSYVIN